MNNDKFKFSPTISWQSVANNKEQYNPMKDLVWTDISKLNSYVKNCSVDKADSTVLIGHRLNTLSK